MRKCSKSNVFEVTVEGGKKEGSMSLVDFVIAKSQSVE